MYCSNCGTQLSDDANFCSKCGQPQKTDFQVEEIKWETCEIIHYTIDEGGTFRKGTSKFVGEAIGPKGRYTAAESPEYKHNIAESFTGTQPMVDALIKQLTSQGWEFVGSIDNSFYRKRFRRRVRQK